MTGYDVCIIGAGSVGAATAFLLSNFTNVKSVLVLEKESGAAKVASSRESNSQTLHPCGIELNYTKEKTIQIKKASQMVLDYAGKFGGGREVLRPISVMALAIGDEIPYLEEKYHGTIKPVFPGASLIGREEIGKLEPYVVKGRDESERIAAISSKGWLVDFGGLANSFIENSKKAGDVRVDVRFGTKVENVGKVPGGYRISVHGDSFMVRYLVVSAGSYTHHFMRQLGLGGDYVIFPVDGKFFRSEPVINGKVYRVQGEGVPFAAVHADADWDGFTRFGPTASPTFMMEKGRRDVAEVLENMDFSFFKTLRNEGKMVRLLLKNMTYSIPGGRFLFWRNEAKKIVPSLKYGGLKPAEGMGGIRAIPINRHSGKPEMGENNIAGEDIVGNLTPSPGASGCLYIAYKNVMGMAKSLGLEFDAEKFERAFGNITM